MVFISNSALVCYTIVFNGKENPNVMCSLCHILQPVTRGTVNGIGQSLAALGRALGPMTGAPLFAWTAGHGIHQLVVCVM